VSQSLTEIVREQARHLATLLRKRPGDRRSRARARDVLQQVFVLDEAEQDAKDNDPAHNKDSWVEVCWQLVELERQFSESDQVERCVFNWTVRVPFPERFMRPISAYRAEQLSIRCLEHWRVNLALSEERIAWMESRCSAAQPGLLRPMRQSEATRAERLSGSELELLRKRGRSRFS